MNLHKKITAVIMCLTLVLTPQVQAKLSQPDFVLYGTATWFGGALPNGSKVSLYLESQLLTVSEYTLGQNEALTGLYALRIPMDANDPRSFGSARPGDPASVFINGNKVAEVLVGDYGVAERLDIDPLNLADGASVISLLPGEANEGQSGVSNLVMSVTLSNPATETVTVDWQTTDDTAIGGEQCDFDVDYIQSNGTVVINEGNNLGFIQIGICGDSVIENSEDFEVMLSNAQNGVIQFDRAKGTILDDDGLPELKGFDVVVFEPESGSLVKSFEFELSRIYDQDVSFNYATLNGSAQAGTDFIASSGTVVIPAGSDKATVDIEFLSDFVNESIENMSLELSQPVNATINDQSLAVFIMDSNNEEQLVEKESVTQNEVADLITPTDVVFSPDGKHVYVSTLSVNGSILQFEFSDGVLNYIETVSSTSTGFDQGTFQTIRKLELSADGQFIYAAASGDSSLMVLKRNLSTGNLTFVESFVENETGDFGLAGVYDLTLSNDGEQLYAVGSDSDTVAVFGVNISNGSLTHLEVEKQGVNDPSDNGDTVTFMDRPIGISASDDGLSIYVVSDHSSSLSVFRRYAASGKLAFRESFKNGVNGIQGLSGAADVKVSQSGKHVYALARASDELTVFNRNTNGVLSFKDVVSQDNLDFIGLESPTAMALSKDGNRLYALGFDDSSMVTFKRNVEEISNEFGTLVFADIEQDGVNGIDNMSGPIALSESPSGRWLIVAGSVDNALEVFFVKAFDLIYKNGFESD